MCPSALIVTFVCARLLSIRATQASAVPDNVAEARAWIGAWKNKQVRTRAQFLGEGSHTCPIIKRGFQQASSKQSVEQQAMDSSLGGQRTSQEVETDGLRATNWRFPVEWMADNHVQTVYTPAKVLAYTPSSGTERSHNGAPNCSLCFLVRIPSLV